MAQSKEVSQVVGTQAKRSPTFDSLRGMGVVLVMLYHLRLGVPNAWACIGLFFAGSGFVMTIMAIETVRTRRPALRPFPDRRWKLSLLFGDSGFCPKIRLQC